MLKVGFTDHLSELCPLGWRPVQFVQIVCRRCGKGLAGQGRGLVWIRGMLWGVRTTASVWNVPKKHAPLGELLFFPIKKEPFCSHEGGGISGPAFFAETLLLKCLRPPSRFA